MKNYYEILEVDRNASQEVIEKAYRTLAKKYHPDLQQGSAEKMKTINDAYDTLSDSFKRSQYNEKLKIEELQNQTISKEEQERILQENFALKQEINRIENMQSNQQVDHGSIGNMGRILNEQIKATREQVNHNSYVQDMQNRIYKIIYKHSFKDYLKLLIEIILTVLLCFLIYQIPPVKQFFRELYYENVIFQSIVDIFKNTFSAKF